MYLLHAWAHDRRAVVVGIWHGGRHAAVGSRVPNVRAGMRLGWSASERSRAALEVRVHSSSTVGRLAAVMLVVRGVAHLRLLVGVKVAVVATSSTASLLEATASGRASLVARVAHHRLGGLVSRVGILTSGAVRGRWSAPVGFTSAIKTAEVDSAALLCVGRRTATTRRRLWDGRWGVLRRCDARITARDGDGCGSSCLRCCVRNSGRGRESELGHVLPVGVTGTVGGGHGNGGFAAMALSVEATVCDCRTCNFRNCGHDCRVWSTVHWRYRVRLSMLLRSRSPSNDGLLLC